MDRNANLERALPSWLATGADEIIIVDWGSKAALQPTIQRANASGRIRLITVSGVDSWILTKSFNLAARAADPARGRYLLKVDSDTILDPEFFAYHRLDNAAGAPQFFAGEWFKAKTENEEKMNGVVYVGRDSFFAVGGYNELIETYGYDDCDLYARLEAAGARRLSLNLRCAEHIPHSNEARISNQQLAVPWRLDIEIEANQLLAAMKLWTGGLDAPFARFRIFKHSGTEYVAEYLYGTRMGQGVKRRLGEAATRNRDWVQAAAPRRRNLYIRPRNGLGNRLRAFCSAWAIAQATNRDLVLVWVVDDHCGARWSDLFDTPTGIRVLDIEPRIVVEGDCYEFTSESCTNIAEASKGSWYDGDSSQNVYIDFACDRDIYIASACVLKHTKTDWQVEAVLLRSLKPHPDVKAVIDKFAAAVAIQDAVGVHVRMGQIEAAATFDDVSGYCGPVKESINKWRQASHWEVFAREMRRILHATPSQRFFVCCDRADTFEALHREFGNSVVSLEHSVFDRGLEQLHSALADVLLLARAKYIMGSNWSSFTELAQRFSGRPLKLAGIDFT
jgi:hypothetical protein